MANLLCGKQMLPAKIIIFRKRFQLYVYVFSFFSLAFRSSPSISPSALQSSHWTLIKNSPQNAHSIQTLFCFYRTMFIPRIDCFYIAFYATCIIIEKESTRTDTHVRAYSVHILHTSIETEFKCPSTHITHAYPTWLSNAVSARVYHHLLSLYVFLTLSRKKAHHF